MTGAIIYFSIGILFWVTSLYIFIKSKEKAFYFLAIYFFINGLGIITRSLDLHDLLKQYPHIIGLLHPLQFLYGPLYLFFLINIFNQKQFYRKRELLHLIPVLLVLIDTIPFYFLSGAEKIEIFRSVSYISYFGISLNSYNVLKIISYSLYFFWGVGYYLFYLNSTRRFEKAEINFIHNWLRVDLILKLVGVISFYYFHIIIGQSNYSIAFYLFSLDSLCNMLVIFYKPSLLTRIEVKKSRIELKPRYSFVYLYHSAILLLKLGTRDKNILQYLENIIHVRKLYLDPNVDTRFLAKQLSLLPSRLDQVSRLHYKTDLDVYLMSRRLAYFFNSEPPIHNFNDLITHIYTSGFKSIISFRYFLELIEKRETHFDIELPTDKVSKIKYLLQNTLSPH